MARTSGWSTRALPTVPPDPSTMFSTPLGTPARSKMETTAPEVSGVSVAGLKTTVLPLTRAGAIFQTGIATGKFQGVTHTTTPRGWGTGEEKVVGSPAGV